MKKGIMLFCIAMVIILSQGLFVFAENGNEVENVEDFSVKTEILELFHSHTGNTTSGGKCFKDAARCGCTSCYADYYEKVVGSHLIEIYPGAYGWANDYETCFGGYVCNQCKTSYPSWPGTCPHMYGYGCTCSIPTEVCLGTLTITADKNTFTKENVELTAEVAITEDSFQTSSDPISFDGTNYGSETTKTIEENGTYTIYVKMENGDIYSKEIVIDYIDKIFPQVEINYDTTEFLHETMVKITAEDTQSGLAGKAYSFDGGSNWQSSNEHLFTENGTYQICTKDLVGNVNVQTIEITNLDNEGPTLLSHILTPGGRTMGEVSIMLEAEDIQSALGTEEEKVYGSGLCESPYSFDGGKTFVKENEYKVKTNGKYSVLIKDNMDNVTTALIEVTNIYVPEEESGGGKKQNTEMEEEQTEEQSTKQLDTGKNTENFLEKNTSGFELNKNEMEKFGKKRALDFDSNGFLSTEEVYPLAENFAAKGRVIQVAKLPKEENKEMTAGKNESNHPKSGIFGLPVTPKEVLEATGIMCSVVGIPLGIFVIIIFFLRRARIYEIDSQGKKRRIGRILIEEGEGSFRAVIENEILDRAESSNCIMELSVLWAKRHLGEELLLKSPGMLLLTETVRQQIAFQIGTGINNV